MTVGPTATQLHQRTLTEEEEPRTTAIVPASGPSSSANACERLSERRGFSIQPLALPPVKERPSDGGDLPASSANVCSRGVHAFTDPLHTGTYTCVYCSEPLK